LKNQSKKKSVFDCERKQKRCVLEKDKLHRFLFDLLSSTAALVFTLHALAFPSTTSRFKIKLHALVLAFILKTLRFVFTLQPHALL